MQVKVEFLRWSLVFQFNSFHFFYPKYHEALGKTVKLGVFSLLRVKSQYLNLKSDLLFYVLSPVYIRFLSCISVS